MQYVLDTASAFGSANDKRIIPCILVDNLSFNLYNQTDSVERQVIRVDGQDSIGRRCFIGASARIMKG